MDSMAVYRGMDIGTAKPSADDQTRVPHHLIDQVDPNESYSIAEYLRDAHRAVGKIRERGKKILFVGGTPLYLKSLLRGVSEGPPADPEFRREVEAELEVVGVEALRRRLEQIDPLSAAKLHPNDIRRMIRALEVHKVTGIPISHHQTQFEGKFTARCAQVFVVARERGALHARINTRAELLFECGLVDEVVQLLEQYGDLSSTASQGVGYQEVLDNLAGNCSLETAIEQTKIRTRRFARRQETWFRGLDECQWVTASDADTSEAIADQILEMHSNHLPS